ncbi:MAG: TlpA family protein disulfide reductase [Clostridia bacterium]|nr:TlpA family protein disulfide reductase [Clostridia bacterium]
MKKKSVLLIVLIVVLAAVLFAAYVIYHRFQPGNAAANLQTPAVQTQQQTAPEETAEPEAASGKLDMQEEESAGNGGKITAPDFSVENAEGETVNLSDFVGKPVVLNFWASWCPPCKSEMPEFDSVYQELGEEVCFMIVNLTDGDRETRETAMKYIEQQGYVFPVYLDTDQEAVLTYGVTSIPTTYFIDKDGFIAARAVGAIDKETLLDGIRMAQGE